MGKEKKFNSDPKRKSEFDKVKSKKFSKVVTESVKDGIVYGKILMNIENDLNYCQISLINDCMLELDAKFMNYHNNKDSYTSSDKDLMEGYHPYFFEFLISLDKVKLEILEEFKQYCNKWIKMKLVSNDDRKNKWDDILIAKEKVHLFGTVVFGASPLIRQGKELVFSPDDTDVKKYIVLDSDELKHRIKEYTDNYKGEIENEFCNLIEDANEIKGSIYNVGQGNCISLKMNETDTFFDVGTTVKVFEAEEFYVRMNEARLSTMKPQYIVLSHWDMDHVIGVCNIGNDKEDDDYSVYHNCCWIAPDLNLLSNPSVSARRLCFFLLTTNKIWLVNCQNYRKSVIQSKNGFFSLWQGSKKEGQGSKKNNIGLIIKIEHSCKKDINKKTNGNKNKDMVNQNALFAGDCEFAQMPSVLSDAKYDFIVTAHHGSGHAVPTDRMSAAQNARAVISVGSNTYKHPAPEHIAKLVEKGFRVFFTLGCFKIDFKIKKGEPISINSVYENKRCSQCKDIWELLRENCTEKCHETSKCSMGQRLPMCGEQKVEDCLEYRKKCIADLKGL